MRGDSHPARPSTGVLFHLTQTFQGPGHDMRPLRTGRYASHPAGGPRRHSADRPRKRPGAGAERRPARATGRRHCRRRLRRWPHEPASPRRSPAPQAWPVPISAAATRAGVSARMVRHYEALGLLPEVARTDSGYRQYTARRCAHPALYPPLPRLGLLHRRNPPTLWPCGATNSRASAQVKHIAQATSTSSPNASPPCRPCNAACKRSCPAAKATNARTAPSWTTSRVTSH